MESPEGFLGIGGSASKTDRSTTLKGYGALENVFNYALPQGEAGITGGQEGLGAASSYWQNLVSGNRSTLQTAIAPEANATLSSADAARRTNAALGTARGGGVAGQNQQARTGTQAQIDNALFGARGNAATQLAKTSSAEANLGANVLGLGETSAANLTSDAIGSKEESDANASAIGQGVGSLIAAGLAFAA
jgi:hypothetical protein